MMGAPIAGHLAASGNEIVASLSSSPLPGGLVEGAEDDHSGLVKALERLANHTVT
jgi:hypothetical protein